MKPSEKKIKLVDELGELHKALDVDFLYIHPRHKTTKDWLADTAGVLKNLDEGDYQEFIRLSKTISPDEERNKRKSAAYEIDNFVRQKVAGWKRYDFSSLNNDVAEPITTIRIDTDKLPVDLQAVTNELNDNLERGNKSAAALLIRRILTTTIYLALQKEGKDVLLKDNDGNDLELNSALAVCQKELKVDDRVMKRVRSTKWLTDSANHSYKVKINKSDVEVAATALRLFLDEVLT